MTLTIAQITDVHLGFDPAAQRERNEDRLHLVLAAVREAAPDLVFVTGDLTDSGDIADYRRLRTALDGFDCPVHLTVGNHDARPNFAAVFPETPVADGFHQYSVAADGLRCIILDTLEPGRHGGGFCARRADWLRARLEEAPARPTLILLHHPPVVTGIAWMDPAPDDPWIGRLAGALAGHRQVIALAAGHLHAGSVTVWQGLPVVVAPSVAPALALSLRPIDHERPDGRAMIVDAAPGFALHRWDGAQLTSHFAAAGAPVLARFDAGLQPMVRQTAAERGAAV